MIPPVFAVRGDAGTLSVHPGSKDIANYLAEELCRVAARPGLMSFGGPDARRPALAFLTAHMGTLALIVEALPLRHFWGFCGMSSRGPSDLLDAESRFEPSGTGVPRPTPNSTSLERVVDVFLWWLGEHQVLREHTIRFSPLEGSGAPSPSLAEVASLPEVKIARDEFKILTGTLGVAADHFVVEGPLVVGPSIELRLHLLNRALNPTNPYDQSLAARAGEFLTAADA